MKNLLLFFYDLLFFYIYYFREVFFGRENLGMEEFIIEWFVYLNKIYIREILYFVEL